MKTKKPVRKKAVKKPVKKPVKKALTAVERKRAVKLGEAMVRIEKEASARRSTSKGSKEDFSSEALAWLKDNKNIKGINRWAVEFVKNVCSGPVTKEKFFDDISVKIVDIQGFNPQMWREAQGLDSIRHSIAEHFGITDL